MIGPEPPEEPKYPQLFESGRTEQAGARSFLLWIEECNIDPDQIRDPTVTETYSQEDKIRFAELGPKPGGCHLKARRGKRKKPPGGAVQPISEDEDVRRVPYT